MSNIVETQAEDTSGAIANRMEDAFDMYFKIHEKVNARSEEIQKSYKNNIIVSFNDIKELHHKTMQSIASLNPAKSAIGVRIAISHNEGEAEKFNSFEAFEKHNITSPNPTASVNMVYTFTLYDAESGKFENYKILNQLRSRIAELKQLEEEAPPFVSKAILASMVTTTARIVVEYTDYVKARHFTAMFDEWIKSCDESHGSKFIDGMKRFSHHVPHFGRLVIFAMLAMFTVNAIDKGVLGGELAVKFLGVYASIFAIAGGVAETFLRKLEISIDSYLSISYLSLNKGDAKLTKDFEERNKKSIIMALVGAAGTVSVGVVTRLAYDMIKWLIT